ncbi:MAG TPA: hypothetical protein VL443_02125 [Cyclobacteriaceae bacterium]|nr:hypothetical protein [Cyclobacteriaceae bacterium]
MNSLRKTPLALVFIFVILSCSEDTQKTSINDLSEYARNYIKMNMGGASQNSMALSSQGNPVNSSFQRLFNSANGLAGGRTAGDSTSSSSDTTIINNPWVSCAVITTTTNDDGSITTLYDYGDGCEEGSADYKYFMFGNYSYTYKNTSENIGSLFKESYLYKWQANDYGGKYYYNNDTTEWHSKGTSDCSGESQYDTDNQTYSGSYTYNFDSQYSWDTIEYAYKGHGKSSYSEKQYVVEMNTSEYSNNSNYYKTEVLEPLVSRYDCNRSSGGINTFCAVFFYVSGREFIRYKQDGKEGSFEINYGDGSCNNVITVIENGKSVDIDLSDRAVVY